MIVRLLVGFHAFPSGGTVWVYLLLEKYVVELQDDDLVCVWGCNSAAPLPGLPPGL